MNELSKEQVSADAAIKDAHAAHVKTASESGASRGIPADLLQTLRGISDPTNAHLFSAEAAQKAFAPVLVKKR